MALDPFTGSLILGGVSALASGLSRPSSQVSTRDLMPTTALESFAGNLTQQQLQQLQQMVGVGPGTEEVEQGLASQQDLATLLEGLVSSKGLPSASDIESAASFGESIYAPQRQALDVSYQNEQERVAQLAAQLGRPVNDPILQAKLARGRNEQLGQLEAQKGSFIAQEARKLPFQQLSLQQGLTGVRSGLATQAFANRQALATLGQTLLSGERNFRVGAAGGTVTTQQGGGLGQAISGGLAGIGTGARLTTMFQTPSTPNVDSFNLLEGDTSNLGYTLGPKRATSLGPNLLPPGAKTFGPGGY